MYTYFNASYFIFRDVIPDVTAYRDMCETQKIDAYLRRIVNHSATKQI